MTAWTGIFIGAAALAALGISRLARAGANLTTELSARLHSVDLSKAVIAVNVRLKNPTGKGIQIQYPYIKLFYKEQLIASSDLKNQRLNIAPLAQTDLNDLRIPVSYLKLTGLGADLIKLFKTKTEPLTLNVEVMTMIHTGITSVPFSTTQTITL